MSLHRYHERKDRMMDIVRSRRGFLSACAGLVPGLLLWRPGRARAARNEAKGLMRRLELDLLKSARPKKGTSIISRTQGDETSLFRQEGGRESLLCRMNHTGKGIWEACNGRRTYRDISGLIRQKYQVAEDRAQTDTLVFLELLKDVGAIVL